MSNDQKDKSTSSEFKYDKDNWPPPLKENIIDDFPEYARTPSLEWLIEAAKTSQNLRLKVMMMRSMLIKERTPAPAAPTKTNAGKLHSNSTEFDGLRYIRLPDVLRILALSKSTLYRHIDAGLFPKGTKIGKNASGWKLTEVIEYTEQLSKKIK